MQSKNDIIGSVVFQLTYASIYVRHFYFPESVYAQNVSRMILIGYWFMFVCILLLLALGDRVEEGKPEEEKARMWTRVCVLSPARQILNVTSWALIIGMGVIGRWAYFIPLMLASLMSLLWKSQCKTKLEKYREEHGIPDPSPSKRESNTVSRYNMIKG